MILRDRLEILNELFQNAKQVLEQYKGIAESASIALARAKAYLLAKDTNPNEVLDVFRRVHDMQIATLNTLNSTIERFPVEHTIQELQMLELFRNLSERQKQQFMSSLEQIILQKRRNNDRTKQ